MNISFNDVNKQRRGSSPATGAGASEKNPVAQQLRNPVTSSQSIKLFLQKQRYYSSEKNAAWHSVTLFGGGEAEGGGGYWEALITVEALYRNLLFMHVQSRREKNTRAKPDGVVIVNDVKNESCFFSTRSMMDNRVTHGVSRWQVIGHRWEPLGTRRTIQKKGGKNTPVGGSKAGREKRSNKEVKIK